MTIETWIQAVLALVGTGGGVVAARAARRTRQQERRDDFTAVTERMARDIARQDERIASLETRAADQRDTIGYLIDWVRSLTSYIRKSGLEPPAPPQPVPDAAREYLHLDG
ncbi:hypothetical protein ABZ714_30800 [Streptomyces sp. NPDC006798]|uniref:hypothetical protein n=1 Tax=unclassified Streptomyces TaxID=2593676 RepID=UPI00332BF719